jgi:glycosyltransferase involved in cell wall biosynthesis
MSLAGILCVRNGFALDYNWVQAAHSLLSVCDELVLSDCDSTDGTRRAMDDWQMMDARITLCNFPWTNPKHTDQWYPEWINYARQHCTSEHCIYLDADEVLHEDDFVTVVAAAEQKRTLYFKRLNFWKNAQSLIPEGKCCGTKVLRMAPANMPVPSDYPYGPAVDTVKQAVDSDIRVFHYGFLRHRKAFFAKAREVQRIWAGSFDPRLEKAEAFEGNWAEMPGVTGWEGNLVDYRGTHPKIMHDWLRDRGHNPIC